MGLAKPVNYRADSSRTHVARHTAAAGMHEDLKGAGFPKPLLRRMAGHDNIQCVWWPEDK